ncbi:MAG: ABC transporter permease, partial [Thermoleophilia bacterium]|nr:ABC transporter permease [Thermoleophilia bacterium]
MSSLRVFLIGGAIAYRALFNWVHPAMYIPTLIGAPLFQILFFAYLGRFAGLESDAFFVVGNAVQACGMASIYGMTMAIANDRWFGTLAPLLATPARRLPLFLGRALPFVVSGLVVSAFGLAAGRLLLRFDPPREALPALALVVVVTVVSCTSFGLVLGSLGLAARDVYLIANVAYFLMLLLC